MVSGAACEGCARARDEASGRGGCSDGRVRPSFSEAGAIHRTTCCAAEGQGQAEVYAEGEAEGAGQEADAKARPASPAGSEEVAVVVHEHKGTRPHRLCSWRSNRDVVYLSIILAAPWFACCHARVPLPFR